MKEVRKGSASNASSCTSSSCLRKLGPLPLLSDLERTLTLLSLWMLAIAHCLPRRLSRRNDSGTTPQQRGAAAPMSTFLVRAPLVSFLASQTPRLNLDNPRSHRPSIYAPRRTATSSASAWASILPSQETTAPSPSSCLDVRFVSSPPSFLFIADLRTVSVCRPRYGQDVCL